MNCMGGWCLKRDHCAYYWRKSETTMERLCEPDNTDAYRRYSIRDLEASVPRKAANSVPHHGQASSARMAGAIQEAAPVFYFRD
jgi:hypothetical protein